VSRKNRHKIKSSGKDICNICSLAIPLEEHHIRGRNIKDPNHKDNLVYICANDHVRIHTGEYILEGWFMTSSGRTLLWHQKGEPSITGRDAIVHTY